MKQVISMLLIFALVAFFGAPSKTLASSKKLASSDTLIVHASGALTLDQVINSDTLNGVQAHKVYKLVTLDTTYIYVGPSIIKGNVTLIGVLGKDGRPPCIQPGVLQDGSLSIYGFEIAGDNSTVLFKNLYITGRAVNNTISQLTANGAGDMIRITGEHIKCIVDRVVFDDFPSNMISYTGNYTKLIVTNCRFRNAIQGLQAWSGEAVRNENNGAITDSVIMKYNTMFCINAYALGTVTAHPVSYMDFSHNNVIGTFKNPTFIYWATNMVMSNNIFYSVWDGASNMTEYTGLWDQMRSVSRGSNCDFDTLGVSFVGEWSPADTVGIGKKTVSWSAEAKRKIEVRNNLNFWPKAVTDFWTAWDDTAHVDTVVTPVWMDSRTTGMFADKTHWPGLVEAGNITTVDPHFGSSIDQIYYPNVGNGVGLFQYFANIRRNSIQSDIYGYQLETVSGDNWIPAWPLPESADMKYSNAVIQSGGTDGKPIGDYTWFTGPVEINYSTIDAVAKTSNQLPDKFALENAYPNPFNPTTNIRFSLAKAGNVNLKVYNVMGQLVKTLINNEYKNAGTYAFNVNMDNVASGVYFYTLMQGNQQITKKMILMK
jgi:hypothetical protein